MTPRFQIPLPHRSEVRPLFWLFLWSGQQELVGQKTVGGVTFMTDNNCHKFPHVLCPDRFLSHHSGRWWVSTMKSCAAFLFTAGGVSIWLNRFKEKVSF